VLTATTGGAVLAAAAAVQAGSDSAVTVALIGTLGALGATIIGGVFTLAKDRKPQPDPARHVPETAGLAAAEMSRVDELLADLRVARAEADLWQQRAYEAGWRP
jgi:hypothetical protein